jgi:uncharacterized protein (TIGR02270 family)
VTDQRQGGAWPPIRWDVVEEHLDEAAFLHAQWERALADPEYVLAEVAEGPEERLLAHLDGLVVAGRRAAERLLLPALGGDDPDAVFAAAWALLASEDGDFAAPVVEALAQAELEPAAAIGRALQLAPRADVAALLAPLLGGGSPAAQATALDVLAHQRLDPGVRLDPFQASPDGGVRRAALRLARHVPASAHPQLLERSLAAADPAERDLAIASGLVVGVRPAWAACQQLVRDGGPAWDFSALVYGLSGQPDLGPLLPGLADPRRRRAALFALGFTGRVAAADAVLPFLGDGKDGKVAGEAFSAVTGIVLAGELAKPPRRWNPEAPEEEDEEAGPAADLPAPDAEAVARRWAEARPRLDPAARLLGGQPWSGGALLDALEAGPMRRREALALDLAVRTRGRAQLAWDGWTAAQRAQLGEARAQAGRVSAREYGGGAAPATGAPAVPR